MDNDETHLNICIDTERKQEAKNEGRSCMKETGR